jgi:hypothetical protein
MRWRVLGVALALLFLFGACRENPNIDGSKVAASGTTCTEVCGRLVKLCGYAPPDCDDAVVDGGGYCQANFDDTMLTCMSTAASCQDAWNCSPAPPIDYDASDATDETADGATD